MAGVARRYTFGTYEIRPESGELWRSGQPVKLAPQPFQVLSFIVAGAGDLRDAVRHARRAVELAPTSGLFSFSLIHDPPAVVT
jgi:hypothetical protein